jgi:hypothetical protein
MLQKLPFELITLIFSNLDPISGQRLTKTSKLLRQVTTQAASKAQLLLKHYGKGQVLFYAYMNHRSIIDGNLAQILVNNGAPLPRFVAQLIVKDVIKM